MALRRHRVHIELSSETLTAHDREHRQVGEQELLGLQLLPEDCGGIEDHGQLHNVSELTCQTNGHHVPKEPSVALRV
jgi:hypothetical protein